MPHYRGNQIPGVRLYAARKIQRAARRRRATRRATAAKNARAIAKLQTKTNPVSRWYVTDTGTINAFSHVKLLTQPSNWKECFRTESIPGTDIPRRYDLSNVKVKWAAQTESEGSGNMWVQVMIVSLKPRVAAKVIERTTRLSNLDEDVDYIYTAAGSSVVANQGDCFFMINPHFYTTHYNSGVRRIGQTTMGSGESGNVTTIRDSTTRGTANVKFKRVIQNDEYNEEGFKAIDSTRLEPRNHLYLIVFSNAQETSELFVTANALFTGRMATSQ
jgi:hypothetical protein